MCPSDLTPFLELLKVSQLGAKSSGAAMVENHRLRDVICRKFLFLIVLEAGKDGVSDNLFL